MTETPIDWEAAITWAKMHLAVNHRYERCRNCNAARAVQAGARLREAAEALIGYEDGNTHRVPIDLNATEGHAPLRLWEALRAALEESR